MRKRREWEEWIHWHTQMPYVYWLPLEEPVKTWLLEAFEFVEAGKNSRKRWLNE